MYTRASTANPLGRRDWNLVLRPGGLRAFFPNALALSTPSVMVDRDAANPGWKPWGAGLRTAPRIYYPADAALQLSVPRGQGLGRLGDPTEAINNQTIGVPQIFLDGGMPQLSGPQMTITGWAADSKYGAPVQSVSILIDSQPFASATLGAARPDVANTMGRQDYLNSGFTWQGDMSSIAPGNHLISAMATNRDGAAVTSNAVPFLANWASGTPSPASVTAANAAAAAAQLSSGSWFSGSTSLAGFNVPNVALLGGGALLAFMFMKRR